MRRFFILTITWISVIVEIIGRYADVVFIFIIHGTRDADMYELVEKILWGVSFIAIGGAVVVIFFLIFAQSILGSKTIHSQLNKLLRQNEQMTEQLKQVVRHLEEAAAPKEP